MKCKGALLAVLCMSVMPEAYAHPLSTPTDSIPETLISKPAVKLAVIESVNERAASDTASPEHSDLPFGKMGLNTMTPSAKGAFTQYLQAGNSKAGMKHSQQMLGGMKDSTKTAEYINNKLRGFYALRNPAGNNLSIPGAPQNHLKGISWQTIYTDTTGMVSGWWNEGTIQDVVSLGGIPVQLSYSTLSGYNHGGGALNNANFLQMSFDRDTYMKTLQGTMKKKYDLNKYFLDDLDIKSSLQSYAKKSLNDIPKEGVQHPVTADQLMYQDSAQLHSTIMENGTSKDSAYFKQVMVVKNQMGDVKEMNQLLGAQKQADHNVEEQLQDPKNTSKMAGSLLQTSFLQKLFMNMQSLKAGNVGNSDGLFMNGIAGTFSKNNNSIGLLMGKSSEMGIQDEGMQSATGNTSHSMQGATLGKGGTKFTALNANAKPQSSNGFNTAALSRNVFVGSISEQIDLGQYGKIDVDLSKSSSQYNNTQDAANVSKSAASHLMDDLWATASIGLAYTGAIKEWNMTQKVYVKYAGLGYVNPGAPFASRGSFQYGFVAKRSWQKNRIAATVRTDIRHLPMSPLTDNKRKSINYAVDMRYKLTRKVSLSTNIMQSSLRENSTTAFLNRKISFMSQVTGKMYGHSFSNNSTLGLQQLTYTDIKSLFLNVGSMHTLMAGPGMVVASVFYNRDINNAAVYNNLLNADGGYQYTLWNKLNCGSSLIYMNSKDVVEQIGIRQQLSAQLIKRLSSSLSADVRHNLYNSPSNYYYGKFNTALSLHYQLN